MKAWEDKNVLMGAIMNAAVLNAEANVNRKKGKRFIPFWKKKTKRVDPELMQETIQTVAAQEEAKGKTWVAKIYEGRKRSV